MPCKPQASSDEASPPAKRVACRLCGELIAAQASKCVHCSEYQSRDWLGLRGKTVWDFASLLIVPAVLAIGGFILDRAATERQNLLNEQRAQSETLQTYFDRFGEILLSADELKPGVVAPIARSKTITTLHDLDGQRRGLVIRLLIESGVLNGSPPLLSLRSANLENTDLAGLNLSGVDLYASDLGGADLEGSKMRAANLRSSDFAGGGAQPANLRRADLFGANLVEANLAGADLRDADLRQADLFGADLRAADLSGARLQGAYLQRAHTENAKFHGSLFCDTTMPDGSKNDAHCRPDEIVVVPVIDQSSLIGDYAIEGTNPYGRGIYKGDVQVRPAATPDELSVHWIIGEDTWDGRGRLTDEGGFYVTFSGRFAGDILLALQSNSSLSGEWRSAGPVKSAMKTGTEVWFPKAPS